MNGPPRILAIATAVPPHVFEQRAITEHLRRLHKHESTDIERLLPAFANAGIDRRYSCAPIDWYYDVQNWTSRNRVYIDSAVDLLEAAARDALTCSNLSTSDIDCIVVVSTTGIATPSLDALLMERMKLKRTVRRLPIFGLGCVGGVLGLGHAATLAGQGETVLFLVVELCTLSFHRDDLSKNSIIATALFGDGAAAVVVSSRGEGPAIVASGEHTFPDTLDIMGWNVTGDGLRAYFSRDLPALVAARLRQPVADFLARRNLQISDIGQFVCHPGGAKILDALEHAFGLEHGELVPSRDVLRDYGNMSAATVLFVLQLALRHGLKGESRRILMNALGPGFTAGFLLLEVT